MTWTSLHGKFDRQRWGKAYEKWFSDFNLIRNQRTTQKIFVSKEGDGAFAVVDVDTHWRTSSGEDSHWSGRTCKTYVLTSEGWKMISQVGVLDYSVFQHPQSI